MKICNKCGAKYFGGEVFCSLDGEPLFDERKGELLQTVAAGEPQEDADPFLGRRIEKYDITRRIGEGGMGEVYEAKHVHIGKRVALKVLREDFSRKEDVVERFRQEARSASIIGHENIIDITDFGTTPDGRFYFVMEYLEGEDLATVFEKQRTIPYERAIPVIKQVCKGLMAAHEKGIIHRDLKPENIYLVNLGTSKELVKILDFGIAKMTDIGEEGRKLTKTGVVFGTPEYMSPEQAAGKSVDERIDIYAMGVIMFEMFTGTVPFTGDTFMSILTKHMFEPVPEMRFMNPNLSIPTAMEQVIMRTLEKEPDERIGSMAELLTAIRKVVADPETVEFAPASVPKRQPTDATPGPVLEVVGDVEDVERSSGRGWVVYAVIAAIVLLLAGGAGAVFLVPGLLESLTGGGGAGTTLAAGGEDEEVGVAAPVDPPAGEEESAPPVEEEVSGPASYTLRVETDPGDTSVEVAGRGQVCDATPCDIFVKKDEVVALLLKRGSVRKKEEVQVSADPTVVSYSMKPPRKPGKGKPKTTGDKPPPEKDDGPKPGKKSSVDVGDLKIPSVYKKKE